MSKRIGRRRFGRWVGLRRLEALECRRVLAGQIEVGLALEHIYQSDPSLFPEWSESTHAVQGDLNGDGHLDLVVFTQQQMNRHATFFAGQGDGTVETSRLPHAYRAIPWLLGDLEGDGDLDLLAVTEGEFHLSLNNGQREGAWGGMQSPSVVKIEPVANVTRFTAADFNGDGLLDLALATPEGVYVKKGLGDGQFEAGLQYPLTQGSQALVAGDLDGDGDLDLISAKTSADGGSEPQSLDLLVNEGEGIFEPQESQVQLGRSITDMELGDVDNDGDLDLVAAHDYSYGNNISVALGDGEGDFVDDRITLSINGPATSIALGDIDDDGILDICASGRGVPHGPDASITVFRGKGGAAFGLGVHIANDYAAAVFAGPWDGAGGDELTLLTPQPVVRMLRVTPSEFLPPVAWRLEVEAADGTVYAEGDWDGNGITDFLVNAEDRLELHLNPETENAAVIPIHLQVVWHEVVLRDFTGDGRTDLLAIGWNGIHVLTQQDTGHPDEAVFTPAEAVTLIDGGIVDLNRDGILDLMLADGSSLSAAIGQGDGTFLLADHSPIAMGQTFQAGDFDADGEPDLLVLNANRLSILLNRTDGTFRETFHTFISAGTTVNPLVDLDGDGDLDVILRERSGFPRRPEVSRVMINTGAGSLEELTRGNYVTFREDESQRLLVVNTTDNSVVVYQATTNQPQLVEIVRETGGEGAYYGHTSDDLDGDGDLDVAIHAGQWGVILFLGSAQGSFTEVMVGNAHQFVDWNDDGMMDLLTILDSNLLVLVQNPEGGFQEVDRQRVPGNSYLEIIRDFDRDGDQDLVLRNDNQTQVYLQGTDDKLTLLARGGTYQFVDLDRDGYDELLLHESRTITIYRRDDDGQLAETTQVPLSHSTNVSYRPADLDGDGLDELLVQSFRDVVVFRQEPNGQLSEMSKITLTGSSYFLDTVGDLDGDGDLDVLMRSSYDFNNVKILMGVGDGTLAEFATASVHEFGDWNSDGAIDVLLISSSTMQIQLGDGLGNFQQSFSTRIAGMMWLESTADLDSDGDRDVAVRYDNFVQLLLNNGDGTFAAPEQARGYHFADWNADGRIDLLTWTPTHLITRLAGDDGSYEEVFRMPLNSDWAWVQTIRDLDQDGDLDFLLQSQSVNLMINAGDGTFSRLALPPVNNFDVFDLRDLNGDGWVDILGWSYPQGMLVLFGDSVEPYQQTTVLPAAPYSNGQLLPEPVDLDRDGYRDQVIAWETWGEPSTHVLIFWGAPKEDLRAPTDLVLSGITDPSYETPFSVAARDVDQDGDPDLVLGGVRVIFNQVDRLRPWGDMDGNGQLDVNDVDMLMAAIRAQDARRPLFDLNRDDLLDRQDLTLMLEDLLGTSPGDANLDGTFDTADFVLVLQNGEYEDTITGNSTWAEGDWDGDGDFTTADLVQALQAGRYTYATRAARSETSVLIDSDVARAIQEIHDSRIGRPRWLAAR